MLHGLQSKWRELQEDAWLPATFFCVQRKGHRRREKPFWLKQAPAHLAALRTESSLRAAGNNPTPTKVWEATKSWTKAHTHTHTHTLARRDMTVLTEQAKAFTLPMWGL